jgi:Heterokaryon incompatibility protein (HET)
LSGTKLIRLLKIHDGSDIDVVSCDVFEVDLDSKPSFEALSYTWDLDPQWSTFKFDFVEDKEREERPILCNGKTHHVTMNLYHALTELRRQKLQTPLWADQICINQHDGDEKVAQLGIMVDVYRSATSVTIWLGKLSMLRSNALDFMEKLSDEPQWAVQLPSKSKSESLMNMNNLSRSLEAMTSFTSSMGDQYHWLGVILVIGRQWFQRAWTLQEFLLATNFRILMGSREISPKTIVRASSQVIDFFAQDPLSTQIGLNVSFLPLRRYVQGRGTLFTEREEFRNGKRYSAEEYLGVIRVRKATEMKDKVFAGAALLKEYASSSVDYRSTTLEIYMAYASERLWPETGIFSLSLVGGTAPKTEGLPSWVPDLNSPLHPEPLRYCGCATFKTPLFSQGSEYRIDNKTLLLNATKWDSIKDVGESIWSWTRYDEEPFNENKRWKMRTSGSAQNERFGFMFALLNTLGTTYTPTGERTIDAFWQTLIGGINFKSGDELSIWRERFTQWFAFTLVNIRSNFYLEKNYSGNRLKTASAPKKWMVPLIADWEQLELRVSSFLDLHDTPADNVNASETPLRKSISHIAKRLWGAERIEESGFWKESVAELLSTVRREQFYGSISFFGQHFESVYDGRRIFVSEKGYLGTGVEAVKAGDLIYLVAGADVPYVLRPVVGKEHTFTLVGEAYVHGIMDGGETVVADLEFGSINII